MFICIFWWRIVSFFMILEYNFLFTPWEEYLDAHYIRSFLHFYVVLLDKLDVSDIYCIFPAV